MVRCQCIFFSKWQLTWRRPTQRRSTSISHVPISLALGEEKMVHVDIFFKAFPRKHHSWISAFLAGKHEALPEYRGLSLNIWNSDCRPHTFAQTSTLMSFITTHKTEIKKKSRSNHAFRFFITRRYNNKGTNWHEEEWKYKNWTPNYCA